MYEESYRNPWYGMGQARRDDVQRILSSLPMSSLLDVATGRGETLAIARELGFKRVMGTEIVPQLLNEHVVFAYSVDLPFADESFELVTCFDVLEHLEEEEIPKTIAELIRVAARAVVVSASELPFVYNGVDQHISKRPADEWFALIQSQSPYPVTGFGMAGDSPAFLIDKGATHGHV
jgi:ubiquinone/menaquinone biosynthesis C-methylase UbiE